MDKAVERLNQKLDEWDKRPSWAVAIIITMLSSLVVALAAYALTRV